MAVSRAAAAAKESKRKELLFEIGGRSTAGHSLTPTEAEAVLISVEDA